MCHTKLYNENRIIWTYVCYYCENIRNFSIKQWTTSTGVTQWDPATLLITLVVESGKTIVTTRDGYKTFKIKAKIQKLLHVETLQTNILQISIVYWVVCQWFIKSMHGSSENIDFCNFTFFLYYKMIANAWVFQQKHCVAGFYYLKPGDRYMRQWNWLSLVQVMPCRLFGAKPLIEPMRTYFQLDLLVQNSIKFTSRHKHFHKKECVWKWHVPNGGHFVSASMW